MKKYLLATALLLASLTSSHALLLSFDSGPLTSGTGDPLGSSFTIDFAYLETVDGVGDPLTNPSWTIDAGAPAVTAGSPNGAGWGTFTTDALDVRDQPVMFTFASAVNLDGFSAVLDDSPFGNLGTEQIQFFDESDVLIGSIPLTQSTPGFVATTSTPLTGVKKIVLPTTALYDNVLLTPGAAVPEPGMTVLTGVAALGLALRRRRTGV